MRETIHAMVEFAARDGVKWLEAAHAADERARLLGGKPVPLGIQEYGRSADRRSARLRVHA